jgi:tetratricopeptide (TPR) repeat protein
MSRPRLIALLLALATLAVYLPVVRNDFVNFDDGDYITKNPAVQAGWTWAGVKWAFTTSHAANWHPLTWLSHMTDCQFFQLNPAGHHFVNALIHALNSALVFLFLLRLTAKLRPSLFIAALFAWHPLHVESVAWASERKDVLSTFFALLALLSYLRFAESKVESRAPEAIQAAAPRPPSFNYRAAFLFFTLGLLAKPMLVTLPFIFLLLDFWPLNRAPLSRSGIQMWLRLFREKIPFFILSAASCVVTYLVQAHEYHGHAAVTSFSVFRLDYRLGNASLAVAGYLAHFFWPVNLCVLYPLPFFFVVWQVAVAALIVIVITTFAWRSRVTRPYFLTGWLWFLGTLIPVIGIVQVGSQSMADRYTYIPSIGFFLALVFLALEGAKKFRMPGRVLTALAVLICAACIFATERQIRFWRNGETLFRHAVAVQDSDAARMDLANALEAQKRFAEAAEQYVAAAGLNPRRAEIFNNLANTLDLLNRPAGALAAYRASLHLVPEDASQHTGAGYELGRLGRYEEALAEFAIATNLAPFYAAPHVQAAHVYYKTGRDPEGAAEILLAARLKSHDWELLADAAHYLAADENAAARNGAAAVQLAARADELTGGQAPFVTDTLAMALAESGDFTNAIAAEQHAIATAGAAHMTDIGLLQHRLELFQNHQPWRESFNPTNTAH